MKTALDELNSLQTRESSYNTVTEIAGQEWVVESWCDSRKINREVPAGRASISVAMGGESKGLFYVNLSLQPFERVSIERCLTGFPTLTEAIRVAQEFTWETCDLAGVRWYRAGRQGSDYVSWMAVLADGDKAEIWHSGNEEWLMKRNLSPRSGEYYEISASRHNHGEGSAVRSFEEAAAIALTLPTYLSVLGARKENKQ